MTSADKGKQKAIGALVPLAISFSHLSFTEQEHGLSEASDSDVSDSSDSESSDSSSESEAELTQEDPIEKASRNAEAAEKLLHAPEEDQDKEEEVITLDNDRQMWVYFLQYRQKLIANPLDLYRN